MPELVCRADDPAWLAERRKGVTATDITVIFTDGKRLKAEIVGKDPKVDLAVLRVKPEKPLKAVKFGDSDKMRVGDWVMAVGNPFGLGCTVTAGIVSARNRSINMGPYDDFIQTDAPINRGNSGGPLFDMEGNVIGVNSAIFSPSGGSIGIGFSVFVVIVAALNLVLDFDFIENGCERGAPRYMEWYAAFGLLVTLVWLYVEMLRLLAKVRSRD